MQSPTEPEISGDLNRSRESIGRRYEAVVHLSEALAVCNEPEEVTKILSQELREFFDFFEFYVIVYKQNSTDVEWAVLGPEKSQVATYAGVPVQERPSWRAYAMQEPVFVADWNADVTFPARLKEQLAGQGIQVGPLVFVPLTTPHKRLG